MKYFIIAGEASGDLHGAQLIRALKKKDTNAYFKFLGGDMMRNEASCDPLVHFKDMAYMGFIEVIKHLPAILGIMRTTKQEITAYKPDAIILIDYPSFNLKIAKFAFNAGIPVYYYISPKVWAWKEYRVKKIKKYITEMYSILPFETDFYARHDYKVEYVGNPSVDEILSAVKSVPEEEKFRNANSIDSTKPIIAILPGSRRKEINDNLPEMLRATHAYPDFQPVIAGAPGFDEDFYKKIIKLEGSYDIPPVVKGDTYSLLKYAQCALVTSGTATLETAIVGVPQVVCYRMNGSKFTYSFFKRLLKVKYVSLPNLIANRMIIPELLLHHCNKETIAAAMEHLITQSPKRDEMLAGYKNMMEILGLKDSAANAAKLLITSIEKTKNNEKAN